MKQLLYITRREILVKLRSKSFYLFATLTPFLFLLPIAFSIFTIYAPVDFRNKCNVGVVCRQFPYDTLEYRNIRFFQLSSTEEKKLREGTFDYTSFIGILDMGKQSFDQLSEHTLVRFLIAEKDATYAGPYVKDVESFVNSEYVYEFGLRHHIAADQLHSISNFAKVSVIHNQSEKEENVRATARIVAFGLGMLLYIMFILFNNNIVKSVSEEKANKLAEVMTMFVNPNKLMFGKIIGLGIASVVQLIVWILFFAIYLKIVIAVGEIYGYVGTEETKLSIKAGLAYLSSCYLFVWLLVFFILGFLLNGALSTIFAVCSSRSSSSVPMVLSNMINLMAIYFCMFAATNPDNKVTIFASYFPLTSHLVIPSLIPYEIPMGQIVGSALILIVIIVLLLFITGKLYRKFIV